MDRARKLGALRQALATLDPPGQAGRHGVFKLGVPPVDRVLGGGLARGAVHEIFPAQAADLPAAAGFAAGLCLRTTGPVVWVRQRRAEEEAGQLYAQGLAEMGGDSGETILVRVGDVADALRAGLEAMRCPGVGAVVLEVWGPARQFDLSASRRLSLAGEESGTTGFVLRAEARPAPSAAATRWQVRAAPSADPLGLPGPARFLIELLRQRGGADGGRWHLEWNHAERGFSQKTLSGAVAAPVADRPAAPGRGQGRAAAG